MRGRPLRVPFELSETIPIDATFTAHLKITADDECEVFVNGSSVGMTTSWPSPVTLDVSLFLHPSKENVVAIRGRNVFEQNGRDRGIVGELAYEVDAVATPLVVTDASWTTSGSETEETDWNQLGFDDSAWTTARARPSWADGRSSSGQRLQTADQRMGRRLVAVARAGDRATCE